VVADTVGVAEGRTLAAASEADSPAVVAPEADSPAVVASEVDITAVVVSEGEDITEAVVSTEAVIGARASILDLAAGDTLITTAIPIMAVIRITDTIRIPAATILTPTAARTVVHIPRRRRPCRRITDTVRGSRLRRHNNR
jgi:hypothetical protein